MRDRCYPQTPIASISAPVSEHRRTRRTNASRIPSADRDGNWFDPHPWVEEALVLLSDIGGGATVLPPVDGAWFNPDTGRLIKEKIVLAYTYVQPGRFIGSLPRVRAFLHRMGRQTRQGEVVAEFNNRLYRIMTYDTA
jgi:hypothetical protein